LAIIGGSGLYDLPGLTDTRWETVDTPWGAPSDQVFRGSLNGAALAFLPRHGRGHRIPPGEVNYRANIAALKSLGATDVLSVSAVGGLRADLPPGTFVIVDQFIDRTFACARAWVTTCRRRWRSKGCRMCVAAPTWRWKGRSFRRWPNRSCTAAGTPASSA